ncbi:MAG: PQQ-binding-like beta-propeller repeat protein [Acidobacteria bacterium]|nr:PQQ-binding-like beta-propeller repeat protein [Acidobacteriota bacterium]
MRSTALLMVAMCLCAEDWPQFRGPGGRGIGTAPDLPTEFGPRQSVVWKSAVPFGHSSPVISGDLIFLTGAEGGERKDAGRDKVVDAGGKLYTFAIHRITGKEIWRREVPRPRLERYQPTNSAASPSPVTDGENVYVFFGDYGLLAYHGSGRELWRVPLGPFNNVNGHGSSPVLHRDLVILVCDQDSDSFIIAVDKRTGKEKWRVARPEVTRSYVTPAVLQPKDGPALLIVPGAYQVAAYYADTGEKAWWVRGFSWQPKSLPVIDGDMIFAHGWEGGGDAETPTETPVFAEALVQKDKDKDGLLTAQEFSDDARVQRNFYTVDLDNSGKVDEREWEFYRAKRSARNTLVAIKTGGRGDVTQSHVVWRMQKFLPNCPSPLVYDGVVYLIKDGGILTAVDRNTGAVLKQGRLPGAIDTYYASPVASGGRLLFLSQHGKATVIKAGREWEVLATSDFEEETFATPAIVDGRMYLRTKSALYCFAAK